MAGHYPLEPLHLLLAREREFPRNGIPRRIYEATTEARLLVESKSPDPSEFPLASDRHELSRHPNRCSRWHSHSLDYGIAQQLPPLES